MNINYIFFIAQLIIACILSFIGLCVSFAIIALPGKIDKLARELRKIREEFERL